jgi:hypothetical protein
LQAVSFQPVVNGVAEMKMIVKMCATGQGRAGLSPLTLTVTA